MLLGHGAAEVRVRWRKICDTFGKNIDMAMLCCDVLLRENEDFGASAQGGTLWLEIGFNAFRVFQVPRWQLCGRCWGTAAFELLLLRLLLLLDRRRGDVAVELLP